MAIGTTGALLISAGVSAATAGAGFVQAGQEKKIIKKALAEADESMEAAKKKLEINYARQLAVAKEPYEMQRDTLLRGVTQRSQAVGEAGPRLKQTFEGRGLIDMQRLGEAQRANMSREIMDINKAVVAEDSRLRDAKVALDLGEVQGAQQEAADAAAARGEMLTGAIANAGKAITTGVQAFSQNPFDPTGATGGKGLGEGGESIIGGTPQEMVSNYMGQSNPYLTNYSTFGMNPITDPYSVQMPNLTGNQFDFWNTPGLGAHINLPSRKPFKF